jgi:hypothetical protein
MGMLLDQNAPTTNDQAIRFGRLGSCVSPKATSAGGVHSGEHLYVTKVIGDKLESSTFEEAKKRFSRPRQPYQATVTLHATDYIEWAAAYDYFYDVARYHATDRLEPTERHKHCQIAIPGGWDDLYKGDDVPPWSPPEGGINIVYNQLHYQVNEGLCYDIIEKIMKEFKKIIKM